MARINDVRLYGMVVQPPTIYKDKETDEYVKGFCTLIVIGGYRSTGTKPEKYNYPRILTRDPEQVAEMAKWKENDIIELKGSLTTKNMTKSKVCGSCGEKIRQPGTVVYIHPIFSEVRTSCSSRDKAIEVLKQNAEISNSALIMGVLCREPKAYVNSKNRSKLTTYQLAVKRKFRIKADPPETDTDFPWVKSYGEQGVKDIKTLRKGSVVLIDGKLQVRERDVVANCPHCGAENKWKDYSMEVVPYAVEYMRNYASQEEIDEMEKKNHDRLVADLFDSEQDLILPASKPEDYVEEKDEEKETDEDIQKIVNKVFEA